MTWRKLERRFVPCSPGKVVRHITQRVDMQSRALDVHNACLVGMDPLSGQTTWVSCFQRLIISLKLQSCGCKAQPRASLHGCTPYYVWELSPRLETEALNRSHAGTPMLQSSRPKDIKPCLTIRPVQAGHKNHAAKNWLDETCHTHAWCA
jgi:hypothetical protein